MEKSKEMLLSLGMKEEEISKLNRWKRVNELRRLSSQAAAQGAEGAVNKYARGVRVTTKM